MGAIHRLPGDEKGNFLVFFGVSVAVLLGTVALSFDLGRLAATQTELQSFADSVALAAAAELDGTPNSVTRARNAAARLITDRQTFASGGHTLNSQDFSLTFLSSIEPDKVICQDAGCNGITPANANKVILVRVDVDPHTMPFSFASVLSIVGANAPEEGEVMASATAGFTQVACDVTPLFMCLPDAGVSPGQMVRLRAGGGSSWTPGNFGFLDVTDFVDTSGTCKGAKGPAELTRCLLGATERITACYSLRGVTTDPGQSAGITTAPLNYRFDMYPPDDRKGKNPPVADPAFAPAPNTIRGQVPKDPSKPDWCDTVATSTTAIPNSMGLPLGAPVNDPDWPFESATSFIPGSLARTQYVNTNHNGIDPFPTIRTRWEYYKAEIGLNTTANPRILQALDDLNRPRLETGVAQCSTAPASTNAERRVLVVAGVDCDGLDMTGKSPNVPVQQFWRVFLTQPIAGGSNLDLYGEMIDMVGGTGSTKAGVFHDVVQLYQ